MPAFLFAGRICTAVISVVFRQPSKTSLPFGGIVQEGGRSRIKTYLVIKGLLYLYCRSAMPQSFIRVIRRGFNMNLTKKILTGVLVFICVLGLGSPVNAGGKNGGNSNHAASSNHAAKGGGSKGGSGKEGSKGGNGREGSRGGGGREGAKGGKSGARGGNKDGDDRDDRGEGSGDALDTANKIIDLINGFRH